MSQFTYEIRVGDVREVHFWPIVYTDGKSGSMSLGFESKKDGRIWTTVRFVGELEGLLKVVEAFAAAGPKLAEEIRTSLQRTINTMQDALNERNQLIEELEKKLAEARRGVAAEAAAAEGEEETDGGA